MISNWRMNYFPSIENERRYKIKVRGAEEDVSNLVKKIGDICGKPSQLDDEDYNWVFYVYRVEAEVKKRIRGILDDMKSAVPERPAVEVKKETPEPSRKKAEEAV